ncbi:hypothetical protein HXX76_010337 [Chlamydomonas incerta]|uniref:Uncharacterized protein n=1 Tax=Chlamydomonas incerta TaxID=51695 RepID=A0A835SNF2_CHLIN|nr:hypothetical protein HXX76_010337 [Chlamydomonas incerta]|eukprot:KAG2430239.1 hypothetical protein HXX76_010337 [Chlamydomonas incerta]
MTPALAASGGTQAAGPNVFDVLLALDATCQDTLLRTFPRATLRDVRLSCSAGRAFVDRQVTTLCIDYASICGAAAGLQAKGHPQQRPQQVLHGIATSGSGIVRGRGSASGRGQGVRHGPRASTNRWAPDEGDEGSSGDEAGPDTATPPCPSPGQAGARGHSTLGSRLPPALEDQLAAALPRWDRLTALTLVLRPGRTPGLAPSGRAPDVTAALLHPLLGCGWGSGPAGSSCGESVRGAAAPEAAAAAAAAEAVPAQGSRGCGGDGPDTGAARVLGSVERLAVWFEGTLRSAGGRVRGQDSAGAYGQGGRRGGRRGRGAGRGGSSAGHQPQPLPLPPPSLGPALALAFPGLRCLDLSIRRWSDAAWVWTGAARAPPAHKPGSGPVGNGSNNNDSTCNASSSGGGTCPLMTALQGLRRLQELRLPSADVLADVGGLTSLTALHVTARRGTLRPGSAAALGGLSRLRRLVLAGEARRGPEHEQEQEGVDTGEEDGVALEAAGIGTTAEAGAAGGASGGAAGQAAAAAADLGAAWTPASGGSSAAGSRGGSGGGAGGGGPEERLLRADVAALLPQELLRLLRSPPPALEQLHFTELTGMPPNSGLLIGPPTRRPGGGGGGGGGLTPSGTPAWPRSAAGSSGGGAGGRFGSDGGCGGHVVGAVAWEVAAQAQADAARGPNAAARLGSTSLGLALGFGARASILAAGPGSGSVAPPPWADAAAASAAAAAADQGAAALPRVVAVAYAEGRTWMGPLGSLAAAAAALAEGLRQQGEQRAAAAAAAAEASGQTHRSAAAAPPPAAAVAVVENFVVRDLWVMPGRRGMPLSDDVRAAHRLLAELRRRYGCAMALRHLTASFGIQLDDTTYLLEEVGARLGPPAAVSLTDLDLYDLEAAPPALTYQLQQQVEARQAAAAAAAVAQLAVASSGAGAAGGVAAGARVEAAAAVGAAAAAARRRRHSDGALGPVSHAAASRAAALVHYLRTVFGGGAGSHRSPPAAPRLGAPPHHPQPVPANAPAAAQQHRPYHPEGAASPASTASGGYDPAAPLPPADQQLTLLALNGCTGVGADVAAHLAAVLPKLRRLSVGFSLPPQDGAVLGHLCELLASTTVGRGGALAAGEPVVVGVCPRPTGRSGRRGGGSQAERQYLIEEMNRRLVGMGAGGRVRLDWALEDEAAEQASAEPAEAAEGRAQCRATGDGDGEDSSGGSFDESGDSEDDEDGERGESGPPVSRWWAW